VHHVSTSECFGFNSRKRPCAISDFLLCRKIVGTEGYKHPDSRVVTRRLSPFAPTHHRRFCFADGCHPPEKIEATPAQIDRAEKLRELTITQQEDGVEAALENDAEMARDRDWSPDFLLPDPRMLGVVFQDAQVVQMFKEPRGEPPSDEAINAVLRWGRSNPEVTEYVHEADADSGVLFAGTEVLKAAGQEHQLSSAVLVEFVSTRLAFARAGADVADFARPRSQGRELWAAFEGALRGRLAAAAQRREEARRAPHEDSAAIALYNPRAHFHFASDAARAQTDPLLDALLTCRLEPRPLGWREEGEGARTVRQPLPLHGYATGGGFDVEGDLVAVAGDQRVDEIRASRPYVGCWFVPRPAKPLRECGSLGDVVDASGRALLDTPLVRRMRDASGKATPLLSSRVLADASNVAAPRVWAVDGADGTIAGFSAATHRPVAAPLAFPPEVQEATREYMNFRHGLTRCGGTLVGSGGTSSVYLWDINAALGGAAAAASSAGDPGGSGSIDDDDDDAEEEEEGREEDSDESDEDGARTAERERKRARTAAPAESRGRAPVAAVAMEDDFSAGDVERLSDTTLLLAGLSGDVPKGKVGYTSLRVVDVGAQRVASVLPGHAEAPSLSRQLCAESHQLAFSVESCGTALIFDLRTCAPAIVLTRVFERELLFGGDGGVLGVPTSSGVVAFTFGHDELIRCWDLRKPASHAYTLSTGNLRVTNLGWHAPTASLLAATDNRHAVSHGRYGAYRYGDRESDSESCDEEGNAWPRGAKHSAGFFPERFDASSGFDSMMHRRDVLLYPFVH